MWGSAECGERGRPLHLSRLRFPGKGPFLVQGWLECLPGCCLATGPSPWPRPLKPARAGHVQPAPSSPPPPPGGTLGSQAGGKKARAREVGLAGLPR